VWNKYVIPPRFQLVGSHRVLTTVRTSWAYQRIKVFLVQLFQAQLFPAQLFQSSSYYVNQQSLLSTFTVLLIMKPVCNPTPVKAGHNPYLFVQVHLKMSPWKAIDSEIDPYDGLQSFRYVEPLVQLMFQWRWQ
jgi:hypothetical protein